MAEPIIIETDAHGRIVLPGHPRQRFLMHATGDGSIVLKPAHLDKHAQSEFDSKFEPASCSPAPAPRRPSGDPVNADNYAVTLSDVGTNRPAVGDAGCGLPARQGHTGLAVRNAVAADL